MCTMIEIDSEEFDDAIETPGALLAWLAQKVTWPVAAYFPDDVRLSSCLCGVDVQGICWSHGIELNWSPVGFWHGYDKSPWDF